MIPAQKIGKAASTDRILILKPIDGEKPMSSTGLVDPRLFSGENRLHVIKNESNNLWSFKYDSGGLPEPLKARFTTFNDALTKAKSYFNTRNIKIEDILD